MRNFKTDLELGEQAEKELFVLLMRQESVVKVEKVNYRQNGYDLKVTYIKDGIEKISRIEVKTLAGVVRGEERNTGAVEVWANDQQTKRPWWWLKGDTDLVAFKNRKRNKWYFYDAPELIKFLENYKGKMVRSQIPNEDDSGWLAMFYWSPEDYNKDYTSWKSEDKLCEGYKGSWEGLV